MDAGHIHLMINHFPVIGTFFGLILYGIGFLRKNKVLEKAGLFTFLGIALISIPTYFSGLMAHETIEKMAGTSKKAVHEHQEMAETALFLMAGLAIASLTLLVVMWRSKNNKTGLMKGIVLVLALITFTFMSLVDNLGGKIRRPELRNDKDKVELLKESDEVEDKEENEHKHEDDMEDIEDKDNHD